MSLRIRLNIVITTLLLILFLYSSFYTISNARRSVHSEIESSTQLALQLIQAATTYSAPSNPDNITHMNFLRKLSELKRIRHLHIEIRSPTDILIPSENNLSEMSDAPSWFVKLVEPPSTEVRRWLYSPVTKPVDILIKPDPLDEIHESWIETKNILIFLLVFLFLSNLIIYLLLGFYLSPIEKILMGLTDIRKGNYELKLPNFNLPELDRISQQFNHMASVLFKTNERNKILRHRLLEIQEEERRILSQELHDELGQTITAIKAVAASIPNKPTLQKRHLNSSIKTIIEYSDHIYQVAKDMMHRLRPSVLDEFGLVKAIQNMVDEWNANQDNIFCIFTFKDIPDNLPESLKISLYRIIQESLTNTLKHSKAEKITLNLKTIFRDKVEKIYLEIYDDGVGVDKEKINLGFGLLGMKERVEMHNGEFKFSSKLDSGFKILILIPIEY